MASAQHGGVQNGARAQPQLHGGSDVPIASTAPQTAEASAPQRSSPILPKAPTSQSVSVTSDTRKPTTPAKPPGDASMGVSIQVGMSMPMPFHQPQVPVQFGGPNQQIQCQSMSASSIQMPMPMQLPIGSTQLHQPVFVPGLQPHPMQPQGIMHQGQNMTYTPQMGPQIPQMGNLGISMVSQYPQQQGRKFGGPRKTPVKITHQDTHEELRLDKRTDPQIPQMGNLGISMASQCPHQQGRNFGVLRNPRAPTPVQQHVRGMVPGPAHSVGHQGWMQRYNSDADRWQRETNFQPKGLMPSPHAPLQVMNKAHRKYEVGKVSDEEQAKQRQLKAILNKLTPQNFEKLFEQVKAVKIDNVTTLIGVISQMFDKALMEPTLCEMIANFCCYYALVSPDFSEDNEKITFKRLLLNKCQEEFERGEREQEEANKADEEGQVKQSEEEREEKSIKVRRRMLGNIRLIGELYKKKMLTERIMHKCIKKLLGQQQTPDEEDIEALCILMSTIGEMIDHPKAKEHMDAYFERMKSLSNNMKLSSRVRFLLKDAIDLRKNKWQQMRKVEGPKKIEEVHRDAAQELQAQSSRLARDPGINPSARRGPPSPRGSTMLSSPNVRSFDRTLPTSPPTRAHGTALTQNVPSENVLTEDRLRDMSLAAIKEFYSARDEKEVALCIKELNSPSFHPSMISLWITDSFERKDAERDLLAKLLVNLTKTHDGTLSQPQLIKGCETVLSTLEVTVNDTPRAPEFLGLIFAKVILENVVSLNQIGQLIHEGGEEAGHLLEVGLAGNVLGNVLEIIKSEKGDNGLNEIRTSSNLRLETFRPPYPLKSSILEKFI